ncbi:M48 family metallopeptidase [bacterium]|nr:M48 family metallopeptidase [bacterium]
MNKKNNIFFPLILLLLIIFFINGCATVPITNRHQLNIMSEQEITASSLQTYNELISNSALSKDKQAKQTLNKVGNRLSKATEELLVELNKSDEINYLDWEFNLIEDKNTANAFCMPGGKIVVYTGILPITKDENGLAAVVGHEIGHAIAKHGNERISHLMIRNMGASILANILSQGESTNQTQQLILIAYGLGTQLGAILPYSRLHESEADKLGMIIMAKAGYDPVNAIYLWQRMQENSNNSIPEFISTHPNSKTRIEQMKAFLPEAEKYYKP